MEDSQEFQMKYETMRKKVLALMKWAVVKPLMALSSFAGLMLPGGGTASAVLMIALPVLIFTRQIPDSLGRSEKRFKMFIWKSS